MTKPGEAVVAALQEYWEDPVHGDLGDWCDDDTLGDVAEMLADAAIDALFPKDVVVACRPWKTNADLIYDAWRLGYVKGEVLDLTAGGKGLWSTKLVGPDMRVLEGIGFIRLNFAAFDFRHAPMGDDEMDTVFYDPPYKLNGNPDGLKELSKRYGVDVPAKVDDRHWLMAMGLHEAIRITKVGGFILAKCQDQVANGEMHWQTLMLTDLACDDPEPGETGPCKLVDRFDMIGHHIPQPMKPSKRYPKGREQRHAHARPSTLLVFQKEKAV